MSGVDNPFAAPQSQTYAPLTSENDSHGAWQQGKLLVVVKQGRLPDRCIKCNASAEGYKLKRSLHWHHPAIYAMILISPLIYIILALIFQNKAEIHVGLCADHRTRRRNVILTAWLMVLAGIGLFFLAFQLPEAAIGWTILFAVFLVLGAIIYGVVRARMVSPSKIDKQYAWLKGAHADYLATFPAID